METKIFRQFLEDIESRYPDSEIVIDIGVVDIFYLRDINLISGNTNVDFALGYHYEHPTEEFPEGKNIVYLTTEEIMTRDDLV